MNYTIARKNGSGAIIWSEDQKRYIISEYTIKDKTLKSLATEFNVQPQSIRNLLRKEKIEITSKKIRNYPRNSNYFENINSSDKAYWLGIMLSDGSVTSKNSINLRLKDKEHVEKFQRAVGATNHKITTVKDERWEKTCYTYNLSLKDSKMAKDLAQYGCVPNKSYIGFSFPHIEEKYYYDFLRGYFDGEGSIYYTKKKYILSWVGSKDFLEQVKVILNKEKISLCQNIKSKICYDLKICGKKDVLNILHKMYDNSTIETRLDRKYKIV